MLRIIGMEGGRNRAVENKVKSMGLDLNDPSLEVQHVPDKRNWERRLELGGATTSKLTGGMR